jgi:flagellin-like protein
MRTVSLRRNKNAVSPVIGTILMVAITVVLAAVLYVMVTGLVTNPGETKPTVSLSVGSFQGLGTTATITSVSTTTLDVSTLTFQVVAGNGTIYFSGAAGTGAAVNGVVVTITYNNGGTESPAKVGPDDNIGISVAQASDLAQIHGTTFKVLQGSDVLGTAGIP